MAAQLKGKVAVVTGSSSGIGEAIAILFASRGAKVTLCGRDHERLKVVFDKVVSASGGHQDRFLTVAGDLNDQTIRKDIVKQTVDKFGRLDILVANAGVSGLFSILNTTEESYNKIMDTNLKSVFFLIQQAVPELEKSKGNIINISSSLSTVATPFLTLYSTSKAAIDHLTRCLSVDLGQKGIRVNSISPGYIPTRIGRTNEENTDNTSETMMRLVREKRALKEKELTVNDIAETVTFLASDAAGFITGANVKVDGGSNFSGPIDMSLLKV